ncbi:DUF6168 family protein [Hyunsoonleella ulvae]|uniref:DUF6168 family protein n=1 Tax=Hyunsoonleella ulvae TaxID=2799948 RepID=UPI003742F7AB
MLKKIVSNIVIIALFASIAFILQYYIYTFLELAISFQELLFSYTANLFMACSVIIILFLCSKKFNDQLGFVFMASSLLKFVAFFIFFYPKYNMDGKLTKIEFFTFFIPYAICLIVESVIISKFLSQIDSKN